MGEDCGINAGGNEEVEELMDTPEKGKIGEIATSVCNFEDSPVFNFLNNLSPIKPVKPVHITQTINPLSFASLPSVFTSPHLSSSLKGSRFLRRHQISDPSKPEFSSDVSSVDTCKVSADATKNLENQLENLDPPAPCGEVASKPSIECSNPEEVDDKNPDHDNCSPSSFLRHNCDSEATLGAEYACASSELVYDSKINPEEVNQTDQNKEATSCDWDSLILDDSNMLVFESPENTVSDKKSVDPDINVFSDITNKEIRCCLGAASSDEQVGEGNGVKNFSTQPEEGSEVMEDAEIQGIISSSLENYPSEHPSGLLRGTRKRCLVYEISRVGRDYVDENSALRSPVLLQENCDATSNNRQLAPTKSISEPSRVLPGIGLHLNSLGSSSKDHRIFIQEASSSGRLLIGRSSSINSNPATKSKELLNDTSDLSSVERENETFESSVPPVGDTCQTSGYNADEEISHSISPKKKRRKLDQSGVGESCKRCNCKKSRCLKLYCECFAAGVYCVDPCACVDCFNKPMHEETVLSTRKQIESRNPLAFAPKVIRGSDSLMESGEDFSNTPASARHKRGCNCKKSGCVKKYCECFQMGVGCSGNCRCEGCKNAFGRKDGTEVECEEDETNTTETNMLDENAQITAVPNVHDQNIDSLPLTPLSTGRKPVKHVLSNKKPPRSFVPCIGSFTTFCTSQGFGRPRSCLPQTKFDKQLETVKEDEIPDFLLERSPISGIKSSSPNSQRVSPPVSRGTSPSLRSSRKLILQSIPAFPSLSSNQ